MPGTRQSTRFSSLKKSESEKTTADDEDTDNDVSVAAVDEGEGITVDLEVKDGTLAKEDAANKSETVEVKIEGVPSSVEKNDDNEKGKEDDLLLTETDDVGSEKCTEVTETDNAAIEKEMEVNDVPVTDTESKTNTDEKKKSETSEDLGGKEKDQSDSNEVKVEKETLEAEKDTEESVDVQEKKADETVTDQKSEEKSKVNTEGLTKPTDGAKPTEQTPEVSPAKASTSGQSSDATKPSSASDLSPASKKTDILTQEPKFDKPFPASLAKLRNLTVNIGPIRQMDLRSEKLHEILKLTDNFEIKFELRDKVDSTGKIVQEKSGFVRLPFEITTPTFLIRVAFRLGNLHIDGRDMSVKFPDAFNQAVVECQQYIEDNRKFRAQKFEERKRQIAVKNVPANVTEDTMRSLFPEAQKITLNMEELPDGGSKVGSVLLEFDTEEACIQCLDTNKDVFVEDCQLKIFRIFSDKISAFEKKYIKNPKPQQFSRGRGFGRGRGSAQRGSFQAAKIRSRAIGFGNTGRGRGGGVKRGGNFGRKPTGSGQSSQQTGIKSPGATNMGPPGGRGQRKRNFSGSKPGKGGNYEGQFQDFTPKRESNRGRQRARPGRGRGNQGHGNQGHERRSSERSPSFRGEQSRQSPYRAERSSSFRSSSSYRNEQRYSSPSTSRDEDPMAMMEYLKSTIARMEEKMTGKETVDRGYDNRHQEQSRSGQFSPRGRGGSPKRGGGRGWGDHGRKRPADTREYGQEPKRQFMEDQNRRDSRNDYYSTQQNTGSAQRRDSFVNTAGGSQSDYRNDRDMGNYGDSYGGNFGSTSSYSSNQAGSYGNRGGSDYNDGSDRNKRDNNYGGQRFNSGYSAGGGQFGSRGGGRGQSSRGRGYNKGNKGQW
ncbi:uncharacterized protein LOC132744692 isoform X2 [Ruditapes philippinarum]|uniref:uncharacterized protein LOC132744692 isoform X2 n=1 Tax=Ruditapes philippinarum TaxID=129788 RepID=UPI00295AC4E3|nr:uncharacterized protein LOC132744692 isoform X2 [Ruditapes philippinarum]